MEGSKAGLLATRLLLFAFSAVVLGLAAYWTHGIDESIEACKDYYGRYSNYHCVLGRIPAAFDYSTFTGVFGLFDVLVGFIALAVSSPVFGWVTIVLDGLTAIFFLAGGINMAVLLHTELYCLDDTSCSELNATVAFQFLGFAAAIAAAVLAGLRNRQNV